VTATIWFGLRIGTCEGRTARARLSWRGLRCHRFWTGRTRPTPGISRRSRSGPLWRRIRSTRREFHQRYPHYSTRYPSQKVFLYLIYRVQDYSARCFQSLLPQNFLVLCWKC
jgi:hypothetical protein